MEERAEKGLFEDAEVLSTYTRAQGFEDGFLVDLNAGDLAEMTRGHFKFPVAMTREVFESCVALTPAAKRAGQDMKGRLHDVLTMLKVAIRRGADPRLVNFTVLVSRDRVRPTATALKAMCGPGDNMEPVITIMFPEQD